jgi:hypothetical protein
MLLLILTRQDKTRQDKQKKLSICQYFTTSAPAAAAAAAAAAAKKNTWKSVGNNYMRLDVQTKRKY